MVVFKIIEIYVNLRAAFHGGLQAGKVKNALYLFTTQTWLVSPDRQVVNKIVLGDSCI